MTVSIRGRQGRVGYLGLGPTPVQPLGPRLMVDLHYGLHSFFSVAADVGIALHYCQHSNIRTLCTMEHLSFLYRKIFLNFLKITFICNIQLLIFGRVRQKKTNDVCTSHDFARKKKKQTTELHSITSLL